MSWDNKPFIFDEDGLPATGSPVAKERFRAQMAEEQAQDELPRICPWCGLLCESVEAELEHEKVCE